MLLRAEGMSQKGDVSVEQKLWRQKKQSCILFELHRCTWTERLQLLQCWEEKVLSILQISSGSGMGGGRDCCWVFCHT